MKLKIDNIRFSSGKATVDYHLEDDCDPALFEIAVCKAASEIEYTYNDLEVENKTGSSLREMNREKSALSGCLIADRNYDGNTCLNHYEMYAIVDTDNIISSCENCPLNPKNCADFEKITSEGIIILVANKYHLTNQEIRSKNRKKEMVIPRQIAMWAIRKHIIPKVSLAKIGGFFHKDHATVLHACKVVQDVWIKDNRYEHASKIKEIDEQLKIWALKSS